jgi:hypothetical protein
VSPAEARSNVGVILARQGKHEEARQMLREALALAPELKPAQVVLAKLEEPTTTPAPPAVGTRAAALTAPGPIAPSRPAVSANPATALMADNPRSPNTAAILFRAADPAPTGPSAALGGGGPAAPDPTALRWVRSEPVPGR